MLFWDEGRMDDRLEKREKRRGSGGLSLCFGGRGGNRTILDQLDFESGLH